MFNFTCIIFFSIINIFVCEEFLGLPGWRGPFGFKQYSGFLKASPTHFLHYWFVESSGNSVTDPVVVWMNGGLGCSSLAGLLSELGTIHVRDVGYTLYYNEHSWKQNASRIFLEAPAGVGFSFSTDGNVTSNDDQTSMENYNALKQFFTEFDQFRSNDLYITGESYGRWWCICPYTIQSNHIMVNRVWGTLETDCCDGCTDTCHFHSLETPLCLWLTFLGHPYGAPCHTNSNDPYYSRNECISDRIVAYYQTLVNCTPFGYKEISLNETATENINWCPPELAVQLEEKLKEEDVIQQLNKFVNGEYEECVKPCKDITLNIYTEYSRLRESESSGNMSRGMSKISIYHKSLEVEEWIERPYTTFSDLVIEVGPSSPSGWVSDS